MGADAVKVLAWYRPDADPAVNEHQKRFVREIGEDWPAATFLMSWNCLSIHSSAAPITQPTTWSPRASFPVWSSKACGSFADPEYGIDLLKLESPFVADSLPARDASAEAKAAQKEFDTIGDICLAQSVPWVLLSGGAAPEKLECVLDYSYAAGASGFLAGPYDPARRRLEEFPGSRGSVGQPAQGWPQLAGKAQSD
ncbi:hypothetical protein [Bradyrhizobium sp. STM 3562]|uniref:hypothetical protein n=1 Tax=Bradyrhizobium sp. STM 3562 TaxID=578924 RepID=UPI00388D5C1E